MTPAKPILGHLIELIGNVAGAYTVAAGDEIAVHSNTGSTTCTQGYAFRAPR